jgi:hypothetical protein
MSSSATNLHCTSDQNSGSAHQNRHISDQRHLLSPGTFTQGTPMPSSQGAFEARVDGSSSVQYSEEPFNINQPGPPGIYSTGQTSGPSAYSHLASGPYSSNTYHADLYQHGYNSFPYSMQRWLSQGAHTDPYHAFVTVGSRHQGLGMIVAEDSEGGAEAEEQAEAGATWGNQCDDAQHST